MVGSVRYLYRTEDGSDRGGSTSRRRAVEAAARIARCTGKPVELVEPGAAWRVEPRGKLTVWRRVEVAA